MSPDQQRSDARFGPRQSTSAFPTEIVGKRRRAVGQAQVRDDVGAEPEQQSQDRVGAIGTGFVIVSHADKLDRTPRYLLVLPGCCDRRAQSRRDAHCQRKGRQGSRARTAVLQRCLASSDVCSRVFERR